MTKKTDPIRNEPSQLRRLAEKTLERQEMDTWAAPKPSSEQMEAVIHELRIHQIELEMQNQELRRTQLELRKAHDRYVDLYDFAPVGYFTIGNKGIILDANLTGCAMLGMERADLVGVPFSRIVFREDQDIFYLHRRKLLEGKAPLSCELRMAKAGGIPFHGLLKCVLREGEGKQIRIALSDISPLKSARDALQESRNGLQREVAKQTEEIGQSNAALKKERNRLKTILDATPTAIFFKDKNNRFLEANKRFRELCGLDEEALLNQNVLSLSFDRDQGEAYFEDDLEVMRTGRPKTGILEPLLTDKNRWFRTDKIPYPNEKGDIIGVIGFSVEVTELMKIREALLRRNEDLTLEHQKRRVLSRQLIKLLEADRRDIARELHDNLGHILTFLKMNLERTEGLLPRESDLRPNIRQALTAAVKAMVECKRVSQRLRPSVLDHMGLGPALDELIREVRQSTHLQVKFFCQDIPRGLGGEEALCLFRIAQESLNNVVKHARAENVFVSLFSQGNRVGISIEDDGAGFDPDEMVEFHGPKGSLGLHIMEERAAQSYGEFTVESSPGKGTEITVEIPFRGAKEKDEWP